MSKPRFETSTDVEKCTNYLRSRQHASYAELSRHLGRDVKDRDRYVLQSARRKLEREGIVFVTNTGIGVERANHAQIASLATQDPIGKIRRTVRRSNKRQKIVDVQSLSDDERAEFYVGRAVLGAIGQAVRDAFKNKIGKAIEAGDGPLPIKQTLDLFRKVRNSKGAEH